MYKRDRALKQQKKALIRANGLKLEAMSQVIQAMPSELSLSSAIQSIHSASKGLPLNHAALPPTDYDRSPFVTSPISMTMPPHGSLQGYQTYGHFPSRAIKSEYPEPYTSSPESIMGYSYMDTYQTSSPASIPHLILELLKCEPDEPQVQAKIMAYLQQEQASRSKHERLTTFGLMCKMADQTLFSIVEWARSSVFFRELKVRQPLASSLPRPGWGWGDLALPLVHRVLVLKHIALTCPLLCDVLDVTPGPLRSLVFSAALHLGAWCLISQYRKLSWVLLLLLLLLFFCMLAYFYFFPLPLMVYG